MIDFPVDLHCPAHDITCACENKIIEDIRSTFGSECRLIIIYNILVEKHNAYCIPVYNKYYMESDPDVIVDNLCALTLDLAQATFPMYKFDKNTYGF